MTSCMSSMRSNQLSYASATDGIIPYAEEFVKGFLKSFLIFLVSEGSGIHVDSLDKIKDGIEAYREMTG